MFSTNILVCNLYTREFNFVFGNIKPKTNPLPKSSFLCFSALSVKMEKPKLSGTTKTMATLIFTLLLISSAHSFYLPGVAPRDFQRVSSLYTLLSFTFLVVISPLLLFNFSFPWWVSFVL